jgi:hypothetical protein
MYIDFAVTPLGSGSSLADARSPGTRERSAPRARHRGSGVSRCRYSFHDVKQRSSFVPAARCCVRVCPSLRMCLRLCVRRRIWHRRPSRQQQSRPPDEGWMERRQAALILRSRLRRATTCPGRPGPLSALHRGGFRMRTHEAGSRQWDTGACSDCPRHAMRPGGRGPDLPTLRFAPQRGTPLLAPSCRIVSRKRPSEPRMQIVYYKFVT